MTRKHSKHQGPRLHPPTHDLSREEELVARAASEGNMAPVEGKGPPRTRTRVCKVVTGRRLPV